MWSQIFIALGILGGLGLLFGALLGIASILFRVDHDARIDQIVEALPGANCGGCGYAGCANFAAEVVAGNASVGGCPVCNASQREQIAKIMGQQAASAAKRKSAMVLCSGTTEAASEKYTYYGIDDCVAASRLGGGFKQCAYACLGLGTCARVCKFDAISVKNGVAVVDANKCTACGMCVEACPKHVIELVDVDAKYVVTCSSRDKGPVVTKACQAGCIGCRLCVKACPVDAITVENNLARIQYDKCIGCGTCAQKCPRSIIRLRDQG